MSNRVEELLMALLAERKSATSSQSLSPTQTYSPQQSLLHANRQSTSAVSQRVIKPRSTEPSSCLVLWIHENTTTVCPISFVRADGKIVKEGDIFMVRHGKATKSAGHSYYEAKILAVGTSEVCRLAERQLPVEKPKQKRRSSNGSGNGNGNGNGNDTLRLEEMDALKLSLKVAEDKLVDMQTVLNAHSHKYSELEKKYDTLQDKQTEFLDTFKPEDKEKYLRMAKNTIALFGTQSEIIDSHMVPLTQQFPTVMVQPMVVRDMEALLLSPQNACSFIFRKLMSALIPGLSAWTDSDGTSDLCEKYKMEVTAAYEFISSSRPHFSMKEVRQLISQMAAESRRTKRKRVESQSHSSSSDNDDVKPKMHDSGNETPKTSLDDAIILDGEEDKVQQPIQEQRKSYEDFSESDLMFYDD